MPRLTLQEYRSRLAYEYAVFSGMSRETVSRIEGYASRADFDRGRPVTPHEGEAGRAELYAVTYAFPHLIGPGPTASFAVALFDLNASGSYPFAAPAVTFTRRPFPWTPHVNPSTGRLCIGPWWEGAGGTLLAAQLAVYVARVVNFDQPREKFEGHYNLAAELYWTETLKRRPYLPELRLPRLPLELTHDLEPAAADDFRPLGAIL